MAAHLLSELCSSFLEECDCLNNTFVDYLRKLRLQADRQTIDDFLPGFDLFEGNSQVFEVKAYFHL